MTLQALRDNIVVRLVFEKESRKGDVIIPDSALKYKQYDGFVYGEVISVGKKYPYELKPGDKVIIQRHEGIRIRYQREMYHIVKQRWVHAKINDSA
jgi:co-chaperonin GroES (HSP10)